MTDILNDRFGQCSLYALKIAYTLGLEEQSDFLKRLSYLLYEAGAFKPAANPPADLET